MTCAAAARAGIPVAVCGEAAADPAAVPALLRAGVRELSVAGPLVGRTKAAVREVGLTASGTGGGVPN
jgi:phosphocarrier protein FPr